MLSEEDVKSMRQSHLQKQPTGVTTEALADNSDEYPETVPEYWQGYWEGVLYAYNAVLEIDKEPEKEEEITASGSALDTSWTEQEEKEGGMPGETRRMEREMKELINLPEGWTVNVEVMPYLMYDMGYEVDKDDKEIDISIHAGQSYAQWKDETAKAVAVAVQDDAIRAAKGEMGQRRPRNRQRTRKTRTRKRRRDNGERKRIGHVMDRTRREGGGIKCRPKATT